MRSILSSAVIGAIVLTIPSVDGTPVNAVKRYQTPNLNIADHNSAHSLLIRNERCWKASNGQVYCDGGQPDSTGDFELPTPSTETTTNPATVSFVSWSTATVTHQPIVFPSAADSDSSINDDDSTDPNDPTATTCVQTSQGQMKCGVAAIKREALTQPIEERDTTTFKHRIKRNKVFKGIIPGLGKRELIPLAFFNEGDSSGNHDTKCMREIKKGPKGHWDSNFAHQCFLFDENTACHQGGTKHKRDAIVDPKYQTQDTTKHQKHCHDVRVPKPFCQFSDKPDSCYETRKVCD